MAQRLRILHLSDLHMGQERGAGRWRLRDVLGDAWRDNLDAIAQDHQVDLVCFTGDLAFSGKPEQYREASEAIAFLLRQLNVEKSRFFCVPGNHDIDRSLEEDAWRQLRDANDVRPEDVDPWIAGERAPRGCDDHWRDAVLLRRRAYDDWLTAFGLDHLRPAHHRHGRLGYRISFAPGELGNVAPLHIVGFDSAWLAGGGDAREQDNANLRLTREQVGRLLSDDNDEPLTGQVIGLMHHPFSNLIERESQSMPELMSRKGLGLLLHGHLHDLRLTDWASPRHGLHISSAGSQYQRNDVPNTIHLLDMDLSAAAPLRPAAVWVRAWSPEGFWHDDNSRFAGMKNGRLQLAPVPVAAFIPTPGTFIGRTDELAQLRAALLPDAQNAAPRPTVICCAIDGMPGVGKTRLAEQFVTHEWRVALGLPEDAPLDDLRAHLALTPADRRDAEALAAAVLSAYGRNARMGEAQAGLRQLLCSGPGGRRLLLIENVDDRPQAEAVGRLVAQLPGCAVLSTARYRELAGASWARVPVAPLPQDKAVELLRSRIAAGRNPYPLDDAQAVALVERLGRLPLALHIAGSHLGRGASPQRFLQQLEAKRLALGPVAAGDAAAGAEAARALIADAFAISWDAWCSGAGADPARQAALVALAHGPAEGVGDALGAAIAALDAADYEDCTLEADSLSLLDIEFVEQEGVVARRTRLHPLIAEFLRLMPQPEAATVIARMSEWFVPLLSEESEDAIGPARQTVQRESAALEKWLMQAPQPESLRLMDARDYANAIGPYAAWLLCFERWQMECSDPQDRMTIGLMVCDVAKGCGDLGHAMQSADRVVRAATASGQDGTLAHAQGKIADILQSRGDLEEALRIRREEQMPMYERLGDARSRAITQGKIADILQSRGDLKEALRIHHDEMLPVFERLGDVKGRAVTQGKIADILQSRGDLEEALRIRRDEILPVVDRLGDVKGRAVTQGQIADILQSRGDLEEALRIHRDEILPVVERLGDAKGRAVTQGKIADILQVRGDLEEAWRIHREEELPVYERLGDVRSRAITQGKIADILQSRGDLEEALRIRREEELPVYERLGNLRERAITQGKIADILQSRGDLKEPLRIRREKSFRCTSVWAMCVRVRSRRARLRTSCSHVAIWRRPCASDARKSFRCTSV